jgi:hypothetical protein
MGACYPRVLASPLLAVVLGLDVSHGRTELTYRESDIHRIRIHLTDIDNNSREVMSMVVILRKAKL